MTVADLRLPPSFVADHCIRTLSFQGALTAAEIAKHWRVHDAVASEVMESLRAAGLVQVDSTQASYERLSRMRLTEGGQARIAAARQRTWYSGVLPVAVSDLADRMTPRSKPRCSPERLRAAFQAIAIEAAVADEMGQALSAGVPIVLSGAAPGEQRAVAHALADALDEQITLPYAFFAAGSVVRVFDARVHRTPEDPSAREEADIDVLKSHDGRSQWLTAPRPLVSLAGGVLPSDVLPAYDEEARFYVAPPPFAASGGLLAVLDSAANMQALGDLVRLWLTPGRYGCGILLLRSGERVEVPWTAATVLFAATAASLPAAITATVPYRVDISELGAPALHAYLAGGLRQHGLSETHAAPLASLLGRCQLATRIAATNTVDHLADRAAYEADAFALTPGVLQAAVEFAAKVAPVQQASLRAA